MTSVNIFSSNIKSISCWVAVGSCTGSEEDVGSKQHLESCRCEQQDSSSSAKAAARARLELQSVTKLKRLIAGPSSCWYSSGEFMLSCVICEGSAAVKKLPAQ